MTAKVLKFNKPDLTIEDKLDNEIHVVWGLFGLLDAISNQNRGDPYVVGALQIVANHRDALQAIRDSLNTQ